MQRGLVMALAIMVAGCGQRDQEAAEGSDTAAHMQAMPMDSGMVMDLSAMQGSMMQSMMMDSMMMADSAGGMHGGMRMEAARDADQMFLRMMSDHHEGLIQASMKAMDEGSTDAAKADAHRLHTKQAAERDSMVAMLQKEYREQHKPMVMRMNREQADSVASKDGTDYDRAYYQFVVEHHREGTMMIDHLLPRLQKPAVRQMAERLKADQQREIEEFRQKAGTAPRQ